MADRIKQAEQLALASLQNGKATAQELARALATAQAAGVTTRDFLRARTELRLPANIQIDWPQEGGDEIC